MRMIKVSYARSKWLSIKSITILFLFLLVLLHVTHIIYFINNDNSKIVSSSYKMFNDNNIINNNITSNKNNCKNTIQGKTNICDSNGVVCSYDNIDTQECCNNNNDNIRYACNMKCDSNNGCCEEYEVCVSCCMHPNHKNDHDSILHQKVPSLFSKLTGKVTKSLSSSSFILSHLKSLVQDKEYFEYCKYICRTNSASTQSENSYRSLKSYCYYYNTKPLLELLPVNSDWTGYKSKKVL